MHAARQHAAPRISFFAAARDCANIHPLDLAGGTMTAANRYDVAIIGAGHNALIAAGLLAKRGKKVVLLERRDKVGGAAVTEQPWGPDWKVTALSYVVSLMPEAVLRELELEKHGYRIYPQHGYFVAYPDGRCLQLPEDKRRRHEQIAKFSASDAEAMEGWDAWLGGLAQVLGPLLSVVPPKVGSKRLGDLLDQLGFAWKLRGLDAHRVGDVTRLMTSSIADLLEDWFESPQMKGVLSVSGVIGTWAGPRSPGTAYVMAAPQDRRRRPRPDGQLGLPGGRHGRRDRSHAPRRRGARRHGANGRRGGADPRQGW